MRSCDYNMRLLRHRGAGEHREISHGDTETQRLSYTINRFTPSRTRRELKSPLADTERAREHRDQPRRHRDTEVVLCDQSLHAVAHEARIKVAPGRHREGK